MSIPYFPGQYTVDIDNDGTINGPVLDRLEFDTSFGRYPDAMHVSGDVYAIAYTGPGADGYLKTMSIASDGTISPVIDTYEFDTGTGNAPDLVHIYGNYSAVVYGGPGADGFIKTLEIFPDGTISAFAINTLEYNTAQGTFPSITRVDGEIHAISHTGPGNDGWISTLRVRDDGTISAVIDTYEFDNVNGIQSSVFMISGDLFGIAYAGTGDDGYIATLRIASDGTIGTVEKAVEYDNIQGREPSPLMVSDELIAVAYSRAGVDNDGYIATIGFKGDSGIQVPESFGISSNATDAFARINSQWISAPAPAGWTHVALTYDRNALDYHLKLYVDGNVSAEINFTEAVNENEMDLLIGEGFIGMIDQVVMYGRALTPAEIQTLYLL